MNVYDMNKVLYELFRHSVVTGAHGYRRHWRLARFRALVVNDRLAHYIGQAGPSRGPSAFIRHHCISVVPVSKLIPIIPIRWRHALSNCALAMLLAPRLGKPLPYLLT